jgi:hypothetical protein
MTIDVCAHLGPFDRRPIGVDAEGLAGLLAPFGVTTIHAGRLEALWFENPHDANRLPGSSRGGPVQIVAVPTLDPTIATWRDELDRLAKLGPLPMIRLTPNYGRYTLTDAGPLLNALARRKIVAQVVARINDPRRQHPLAQVPDVPALSVLDAATRHPEARLLLSGAQTSDLTTIAPKLPKANNLWADTSQADGVEAVASLMKTPWRDRLVFGSHAPLFIPYAALARVVLDLDDATALRVLRGNASAIFSSLDA